MSYVEQFFESERSNRRIIHAIARSLAVDADAVESDALYRLTRSAPAATVPFGAALRVAARQSALDIKRCAHSRHVSMSLDATAIDDAGDTHAAIAEPSCASDADRLVMLRAALQTLTPKERAALLSDESSKPGAMAVAKSRARKKLVEFFAAR